MSLRALRIAAGMSQTDLAEAAGLAQFTISRLETGANQPQPTTIRLLAAVLTKGDTAALMAAWHEVDGEASGAHAAQPSSEGAP